MVTSKIPIPTVGTPATVCYVVDSYAATVIFADAKTIKVQCDKATRTDNNGLSESQRYDYERDPEGTIYIFTLRRDGVFRQEGCKKGRGVGLHLGSRRSYRDPSG